MREVRGVSSFDREWRWESDRGGFGVVLNDPVDLILQRLSVAYLDEAKRRATAVLAAALDRVPEMKPVYFHPAKCNWFPDDDPALQLFGPFVDRGGPFGGPGWVDPSLDAPEFVLRWPALLPEARDICVELIEGSPSLALCGGGIRAQASPIVTDAEAHLACLVADNAADGTDWVPDRGLAASAAAEDAPLWLRAPAAAERCDADAFRTLEAEAHRYYSPAGYRMLSSGLSQLLICRLAEKQAAEAGDA